MSLGNKKLESYHIYDEYSEEITDILISSYDLMNSDQIHLVNVYSKIYDILLNTHKTWYIIVVWNKSIFELLWSDQVIVIMSLIEVYFRDFPCVVH